MNVLLAYRGESFVTEAFPEIIKHKNDIITLIVKDKNEQFCIKAIAGCQFRIHEIDTIELNIITAEEYLKKDFGMKFDHIAQNPPYEVPVGDKKTQIIWAKIVIKSYELLKDGGTMTSVHPGGWRFALDTSGTNLKKIKEIYTTNKIVKMELNDIFRGEETFGATTDYDVITLVKEPSNGEVVINTRTNKDFEMNIKTNPLIPTDGLDIFESIRAKDGEEKVELLYSRSAYGSDKKNIVKDETVEFKYPIIYTITNKNGINLMYSNTNQNGHFGVPKLIIKKGSKTSIIDETGKYGLAQFAAGIVDEPENLVEIQQAIDSEKFRLLQQKFTGSSNIGISIDGLGTMYKFIKEFRKDWYKDFI